MVAFFPFILRGIAMRHANWAALFLLVLCAGTALSQEPPEVVPQPRITPGVIASLPVGVAILVAGTVGWIVLGAMVWFLERRR
jgi:predicted cobalt transporter CbtA